ncbi:hypothetical protein [Arsenophonus endosymbiont of Apis mellifera]|uniref:hypothetical protein n=1 Tax=Arsenophonus endosymbiont of Apis mellifera TaxID=1541805 RepID=UPI001F426C1B|nr:hypothetical protein [Arsenophonus endosymbiont of Apis mellifera]
MKDAWCRLLATDKLPEDHYAVFKAITKFSKVDKNKVYDLIGISKIMPDILRKPGNKSVLLKISGIKSEKLI